MYFIDQCVATQGDYQCSRKLIPQGQTRRNQGDHGNGIYTMRHSHSRAVALNTFRFCAHGRSPYCEGHTLWRQQPFMRGACKFYEEGVFAWSEWQAQEAISIDSDF